MFSARRNPNKTNFVPGLAKAGFSQMEEDQLRQRRLDEKLRSQKLGGISYFDKEVGISGPAYSGPQPSNPEPRGLGAGNNGLWSPDKLARRFPDAQHNFFEDQF